MLNAGELSLPISPGVNEVAFSSKEGMPFGIFELEHAQGENGGNDPAKGSVGHNGL